MTLVRKIYRAWKPGEIYDACKLCLITSNRWLNRRSLQACVADAIVGGVSLVQFKMGDDTPVHVARRARDLIPVCRVANIPFVVDGDIEAAKTCGADGVHLGFQYKECEKAREEFGHDAIIGVSAFTVDQAKEAMEQGASYLSVGPVFPEVRGSYAEAVGLDTICEIVAAVDIPVIAAGGINESNIHDLAGLNLSGVACSSAILAAPDIEHAAEGIANEVNAYIRSNSVL